jgi:zinc protease
MAFTLEAMSEERLEVERRVVLNEMHERRNVGSAVREQVRHALFPTGHVYRHLDDRDQDVDDIELDDARWFFQQHYRPENATLVLVGNLRHVPVRELIERYFGPLRAIGAHGSRASAPAVVFGGSQRMTFEAPLPRTELQVRWMVPCRDVQCAARLELLRVLLAGHEGAPLWVPYGDGSATSVDMSIRIGEQHAEVLITAKVGPEGDAERVLGLIDRELASLRNGKIADQDLRMARFAYATATLYAQESLLERAMSFAIRPDWGAHALVNAATALSAQDLAAAAKEFLPSARRLVVEIKRADRADYDGELEEVDGALLPRSPSSAVPAVGGIAPPGRPE